MGNAILTPNVAPSTDDLTLTVKRTGSFDAAFPGLYDGDRLEGVVYDDALARRIAAALNALAGVPTDVLEVVAADAESFPLRVAKLAMSTAAIAMAKASEVPSREFDVIDGQFRSSLPGLREALARHIDHDLVNDLLDDGGEMFAGVQRPAAREPEGGADGFDAPHADPVPLSPADAAIADAMKIPNNVPQL